MMLIKNYRILIILAFLLPVDAHPKSNTHFDQKTNIGLATGGLLSLAWWAYAQHNHSKTPHTRYPLIQRRNQIAALLTKETNPNFREKLTAELAEIEENLTAIQDKRSSYQAQRVASLIAAIGLLSGTIYGNSKK